MPMVSPGDCDQSLDMIENERVPRKRVKSNIWREKIYVNNDIPSLAHASGQDQKCVLTMAPFVRTGQTSHLGLNLPISYYYDDLF